MDETTVASTNTPMSHMTATQQSTIAQFNELEADIQSNQQDFQRVVSNQMEQMDKRINRIMQANATTTSQINTLQAQIMQSSETNSQQFQIMQTQISQMLTQLATIVDQQRPLSANQSNDNMSLASQDSQQSHSTTQSRGSSSKNSTSIPSTKHSPEKKKQKPTFEECRATKITEQSKTNNSSISNNTILTTQDEQNIHESDSDQSEVQYKYPPLPDGGDSEWFTNILRQRYTTRSRGASQQCKFKRRIMETEDTPKTEPRQHQEVDIASTPHRSRLFRNNEHKQRNF